MLSNQSFRSQRALRDGHTIVYCKLLLLFNSIIRRPPRAASQHRAQLARAQAEVARVRKECDRARTDAARYYRERQLARAEVVELRVARSTAVVQQALRPELPGSPEHE